MAIYIVVFLILLIALFPDVPKRKDLLIGAIILMYLIGMFRSLSVGTDNYIYSKTFEKTTWESLFKHSDGVQEVDFEIGYSLLVCCVRFLLIDNYLVFMSISFFMTMSLFLYFITKSKDIYISLFLFFTLSYYFLSLNIMRQMMGCSIILALLPFFIRKQMGTVQFCICIVLISFGFHKSLLVFLLAVLLYQKTFERFFSKKKNIVLFSIISFVVLLGFSSLNDSISSIRDFFILLGNERYAEYLSPDNLSESKISVFSSFLKLVFFIYLVYISPIRILKSFSFIGLFLSICMTNIFGSISALFTRVPINVEIMFVIFIPYLYSILKNENKKNLFIATVCYSTIFFFNYLYKGYAGVVPYSTYLLDF